MSEQNNTAVEAQKLDPNMRIEQVDGSGIRWLSPQEPPLRLSGFAWVRKEGIYRRLPKQPERPLPTAVDRLANATSGGQIAFQTNSRKVLVRVALAGAANMHHMPSTAQCGFDCYLGEPGKQQYVSTTRYDHKQTSYESMLYELPGSEMRHVTLNFPLYQGVQDVWVGVEEGAEVLPPVPYQKEKKVIIYGTSVTQGGCASRPGMSYSNILSRRIPLEFVNLGFSGNGRGDPEVAHLIADIDDPALVVLDYEGNCGEVERMERTLPVFIGILRETHPTVPILVLSRIRYAREAAIPSFRDKRMAFKAVEKRIVEQLRQQGDENVHFHDCEHVIPEDIVYECSVDGAHLTDLGFLYMAEGLLPVLTNLLQLEQMETEETQR